MLPEPIFIGLLLLTSAFAGFAGGLLGVGGGLINVPVITYVLMQFGLDVNSAVQVAIGTSLTVIIFTGSSSSITYALKGHTDLRVVAALAPAGAAAALAVSLLAINLHGGLIARLFGVFGLLVAWRMFSGEPRWIKARNWNRGGFAFIGALSGAISALFGVGGGVVAVPMQELVMRIDAHRAHANSCVLVTMLALIGALVRLCSGHHASLPPGSVGLVYLPAVALMAPPSIAFAWAGARLATRTDQAKLRRIFALLMLAVGVRMIIL
ncbi:MAG: sulfite exporter TauE/SafE family protein [Candidatus Alcyoniella australis]|nr:sulfite exporter TauE/SafE family protein [Candidatus Alcyoniella australis]